MSFAGHVQDMIIRSKQNRALLMARRERMREMREKLSELSPGGYHKFVDKQVSREELKCIKAKIRKEIKRQRIRSLMLSVSFTVVVLTLLVFLIRILVFYLMGMS